ncbi:MAG: glycosyltransferase [Phycisphaerae bacterium]|nr:glycosyltransferase [Phycisphaerae bacterium]
MKKKMAKNYTTRKSYLIQAVVMLLLINLIVYVVFRAVFVSYNKYGPIEKVLSIFLFIAEGFVLLHAFGYFIGVYRMTKFQKAEPGKRQLTEFPPVAILIAARHEPKKLLENTVISCYNLSYPAKTIYILDDSSEQKYKDEAEDIAERYDCRLFRRETRHGAKAGVVNDCVKKLTDKYIVIFDVDQSPMRNFLNDTVAILESNPRLAFIQTPQFYSNLQSNRVALASDMQQACFYEYICESKSTNDTMMSCGTNVVIRKEALDDVGGLDELTVTEDFATSLNLHLKGWETLYYNHVGVFGQGPENLSAYFNQQNRWAMGAVGVLKKTLKTLLKTPSALRPIQWWEYIITSSYYWVSWAYLFLILCPLIYIFFGVPSFFMSPEVYVGSFLPYLILSNFIFITTLKSRNYGYLKILQGQIIFFLALPVYLRGTLLGLLGINKTFTITAKGDTTAVPYIQLWPQLLLWAINLAAITWGVNKLIYSHSIALAANLVWIICHFTLYSFVFYFNEDVERAAEGSIAAFSDEAPEELKVYQTV